MQYESLTPASRTVGPRLGRLVNWKKTLVCATVLICIWNAGTQIKAARPEAQTAPYLSFKFPGVSDQKGKSASDAITLKRAERCHFQIQYVTQTPYRPGKGVNYGPLSIQAINQHPDFFKERPGPTVSLEVTPAGANERALLPVRVFSSGSGYSDGVHYLSVSIDILEPETVRREELGQFVSQIREAAESAGFPSAAAKGGSEQAQTSIFDEIYISNPVGLYHLKAVFLPDLANPQRALTASVYLKVLEGPDSLDLIRQKLYQKR
ncbi:MAG TPA: hypothetical protein VFU31_24545 [Candidatus Binatia bacterium]|nr:hypothetical protein [Candidatus Binatia bacterium]